MKEGYYKMSNPVLTGVTGFIGTEVCMADSTECIAHADSSLCYSSAPRKIIDAQLIKYA